MSASTTSPASASGATSTPTPSASSTGVSHGRIEYTGAATGTIDATMNVFCSVEKGKLVTVAITASDDPFSYTAPAFLAGFKPQTAAILMTPDEGNFVDPAARGLSAAKKDGTWTLTVDRSRLDSRESLGDFVIVHGHLTCTKVSGH